MRRMIFGLSAAAALSAGAMTAPVAAQDGPENDPAAVMDAIADLFPVEPLTPEQEARLPLAREAVERIVPDGAMADMLDNMMGGIFNPMMGMDIEPSASKVADQLGLYGVELTMDDAAAAEALALLDPAWREREKIEREMFPAMMSDMMVAMEPVVKKTMTELYAVHFTQAELTDINAFFSTPTGAAYARKSFTLASDPRLMGMGMEALPEMMGMFEDIDARMETATAGLPEMRSYDSLTAAQKARLSQLTGMSEEKLDAVSADMEANLEAMIEDMDNEM